MGKVRIVDVAREAGVSLGTVSNALNHPEKVRPETRKLIDEAIQRLGYLPNQSARLLAGGRTNTIGLVLPGLTSGCSLQIANGARNEAMRHGYDLLVMSSDGDSALEDRYLNFFVGIQVAGILVQPAPSMKQRAAAELPVPTVYLDVPWVSDRVASVAAHYRAQGRLIAEHVLARGAERVAVVGRAENAQLAERLEGIRDMFPGYGDVSLEIYNEGATSGSGDGARLGAMLASRNERVRPDAIIGLTDAIAMGALAGVMAAGCSVPHDIMVAGCDGNPLAWGGPLPLTTCSPAGYELGRKGAQLIIERVMWDEEHAREAKRAALRGFGGIVQEGPPVAHETVRPFLLERASTARGILETLNASGASAGVPATDVAAGIPEYDAGAYL